MPRHLCQMQHSTRLRDSDHKQILYLIYFKYVHIYTMIISWTGAVKVIQK